MKTIGEELHGQHVRLKCPLCERKWSKKVILNITTKCDNTRCEILVYMEQHSSGDVMTTFSVDPNEANAAAIEANIMSRKIKADLESNDYHNTIN